MSSVRLSEANAKVSHDSHGASLGGCQVEIPGREGWLSAAASLFSPSEAGHCLLSSTGPCAPFLTQGQGLGDSESPHLSDSIQLCSDFQ